MTTQDIKAI